MVRETRSAPDPRFGMEAPFTFSETVTSPDGHSSTTLRARTVTMDDPVTLGEMTTTADVNGRVWTETYENQPGTGGTVTATSPEGREASTEIDEQGRIAKQSVLGHAQAEFTFDSRGRVEKVEQGSRSASFTFDSEDRIATMTDAKGRTQSLAYDEIGRPTGLTADTGREWHWAWDDDGNVTKATLPSGAEYDFTSTPENMLDEMTLPGGGGSYDRSYSQDRLLEGRTEPSGVAQTMSTDPGGRVSGVTTPETSRGFGYAGTSELPGSFTWNRGGGAVEQTLDFAYDGALPKTSEFSGDTGGSSPTTPTTTSRCRAGRSRRQG